MQYDFCKRVAKESTKPIGKFHMPEGDYSLDDAMADYLSDRDLSFSLALHNGWYPSREAGDSYPRIVIPARSSIPGLKFWQARAIDSGVEPRYQSPHGNRYDSVVDIMPTRKSRAKSYDKYVFVTEGPMDALAVAELGYRSIATLGNCPPRVTWAFLMDIVHYHMFKKLSRSTPTLPEVIALPDLDDPAFGAKIVKELGSRGLRVHTLRIDQKDFATLAYKERHEAIKSFIPSLG